MQMQQATVGKFDVLKVRVPRAWTPVIKSAAQSEAETIAGYVRIALRKQLRLPGIEKTND
jgi:hypothetical protein